MSTFDFHRLTFEEAVALRLGESRMTEPPTALTALIPSAEQLAEWDAWVASRPEPVRSIARRIQPWKTYRLTSTGQLAAPLAFSEDGTVRALCWREELPPIFPFEREVFGLDPDDFVEVQSALPEPPKES